MHDRLVHVYCRPQTPIGDIVEHKYQKCWIQQGLYSLLDRKEQQTANVSRKRGHIVFSCDAACFFVAFFVDTLKFSRRKF